MPFRLDEHRAKIQFVVGNRFPSLIYKACLSTGTVSNTRYLQEALCRRLAEDTGTPYESLMAQMPEPRGKAAHLFGDDRRPAPKDRIGPGATVEEVK